MEQCLCGASDCHKCYPLSWKDNLFDEIYDEDEIDDDEDGEEINDDYT